MSKPFNVNHWGSHPDANNDDCFTGDDFATLEEAKASALYKDGPYDVQYIELDGPDVHEVCLNPCYSVKQCRLDDSEWRNEHATQAGMAFGCDGYNEAMGYD
jgi:hypothetical protein